jgi:hypothetical protein
MYMAKHQTILQVEKLNSLLFVHLLYTWNVGFILSNVFWTEISKTKHFVNYDTQNTKMYVQYDYYTMACAETSFCLMA